MSVRFGAFFGQSEEFWHGIQVECDFRALAGDKKKLISRIQPAALIAQAS
jgi:plasmid maintenance system antidote protein VapI